MDVMLHNELKIFKYCEIGWENMHPIKSSKT